MNILFSKIFICVVAAYQNELNSSTNNDGMAQYFFESLNWF